jgi:hypothetical protein
MKIVLNTKGTADDVSDDIKELLHYIGGDEPKSKLTHMLDEEVQAVKSSEKWRREYMLLWERDEDNIELGTYRHLVKQCRKLDLSRLQKRIKEDVIEFYQDWENVVLDVTHCDELDREREFKNLFNRCNFYGSAKV